MTLLVSVGILIGASLVIATLKRLLHTWLRPLGVRLRLPYETVRTVTRAATGILWVIAGLLILELTTRSRCSRPSSRICA
jgi:hypothetical protein